MEIEGGQLSGPAGYLMILIGLASWCLMPYFKVQLMLTAGAAAFILGVVLLRKKMWWVCTECGERYPRKLPPRGFESSQRVREEEDLPGPPERREHE